MKNIIIIIIAALGFVQLSFGQDEFELTDYNYQTIPVSPTAASLGSYGESPISLATGTPNISVPIWTLNGKSLSVPISMSYRPGIKLDQLSEYTGIGWSLMAGGVITRKIVDQPDGKERIVYDPNRVAHVHYRDAQRMAAIGSDLDGGTDVFNYNFNGISGQFALNDDFSIYYIDKFQNWKFSYSEEEIIIITQDGTKFIFSDTETTTVEDSEGNISNNAVTAWHLSSIVSSMTNERIDFKYYTEGILDFLPRNRQLLMRIPKFDEQVPGLSTYDIRDVSFEDNILYATKKIESIILYKNNIADSKVTFEAKTFREDLQTHVSSPTNKNAFALSRINIYKKADDVRPLKYFDFNINSELSERMYLSSITEFSGDGESSKPPYRFKYYNVHDFPERFSKKSDFWGYYSKNGTEFPYHPKFKWRKDKTKLPAFPEAQFGSLKSITFPTGGKNEYIYVLNGFHRRVLDYEVKDMQLEWAANHWRNAKDGTASNQEQLIFTLSEASKVEFDATLKVSSSLANNYYDVLRDAIEDYQVTLIDNNTGNTIVFASFDGNGDPDQIDAFVYHNNVKKAGYLDPSYSSDPEENFIDIGGEFYRNLKFRLNAGAYTLSIKTSQINTNTTAGKVSGSIRYSTGASDVEVPINGIRIASQKISDEQGNTAKEINYSYRLHEDNGNMTNKSSGEIPDDTYYNYLYTENNKIFYAPIHQELISHGILGHNNSRKRDAIISTVRIFCVTEISQQNGQEPYLYTSCTTLGNHYWEAVFNSKSKFANHTRLGYQEVRVEENGNGFVLHKFNKLDGRRGYEQRVNYVHKGTYRYDENGNIEVVPPAEGNYSGHADPVDDDKGNPTLWPYSGVVQTSSLWKKPKETLTYKLSDANQTPKLLQKENFEYLKYQQSKLYQLDMDTRDIFYVFGITEVPSDIYLLKSKKTETYNVDDTNNFITNNIGYDYDLSTSYQPIKITTTNSDGEEIVKKYKYTNSYISNTSTGTGSSITMQDLKNQNIIGPIEEQIWVRKVNGNYRLIDGKVNVYNKISASNTTQTLYQPIDFLSFEASSINSSSAINNDFAATRYFDKVNWLEGVTGYDYNSNVNLQYDTLGNLIQVQQRKGTYISYLWGYNDQYPIAKIENATFAEVATALGISQEVLKTYDETKLIQINDLRNSLPKAMVTTYTYEPLIGMSSVTDPRGYVMTYHYDDLNRLEFVKDQDGNLISENQYNYKN